MSNKETALKIVNFDKPERVLSGLPTQGLGYYGIDHQGFDAPEGHNVDVGTKWFDIWGTGWEKEHAGVMGFPKTCPLADPRNLSSYEWLDPNDERLIKPLYEAAEGERKPDTFLQGRHRDTLWEKSYMLVGMENMMMYFYTEPEYVREVLHRIMDFQLGMAEHYLKLGIEAAGLGDDMGTQAGPLLGPDVVQEFLVPEYRRLFDLYKEHDIIIEFHSCGNITWMLETFMDLGVDILNPIQATANNLDEVREKTAGKMALHGAISSGLLVSGPVEKIKEEVKNRIEQLGSNGGYFCGPDQGMPWPEEHYQAYKEALEEYGVYPLRGHC